MTSSSPITAPQSAGFSPKQFQARIIHDLARLRQWMRDSAP
ncbi:MAG TPA: hypothetical protein VIK56_08440 [Rhodoferax sp.]